MPTIEEEIIILSDISFTELQLAPEILKALTEQGYTTPTPIQAQAIPIILAGHDLMAGAQTGTGKTAAFALPILQKLLPLASASASPARHPVRALILVPTRELAIQVDQAVRSYAKHCNLRSLVVYGGVDIRAQITGLRTGVEILVATPGRLRDHLEQKSVQLNQVQLLVLDEADRMLDMGFVPDLKRILPLLPKQRQNLMFSATFSNDIKKLAAEFLLNPVLVEAARSNATADNVTQKVYLVEQVDKLALLAQLLREGDATQTLIFTKTKLTASRVAHQLQRQGVAADAIHSDKSQLERIQVLDAFKQGKVIVLIGTDVAARGLDIDQLPVVINYEIPHSPEDYIHRIGRTGRAGASGTAISLVAPEEERYLKEIEKLIKCEIQKVTATLPAAERKIDTAPRERVRVTTTAVAITKKSEHDSWFDKPYEPSLDATTLPPAERPATHKLKGEISAILLRRQS